MPITCINEYPFDLEMRSLLKFNSLAAEYMKKNGRSAKQWYDCVSGNMKHTFVPKRTYISFEDLKSDTNHAK